MQKYVVLHSLGDIPYSCYVYDTLLEALQQFNFIVTNQEDPIRELNNAGTFCEYGDGNTVRVIESDN
ncbi:MAG: hypothetical protein P4N59_03555 [Negativicutes bacterium]|nr:hypothetical protein [Negativicutes bacterium]